jgi:hypothetical protein
VLQSPDKRVTSLPPQQATVGPLARGGLWSVAAAATSPAKDPADGGEGQAEASTAVVAKGPPEAVIAVNLVRQAESEIRGHLDSKEIPQHLLGNGPSQPIWMWLVALAGLICLIEWIFYHRRVLV